MLDEYHLKSIEYLNKYIKDNEDHLDILKLAEIYALLSILSTLNNIEDYLPKDHPHYIR